MCELFFQCHYYIYHKVRMLKPPCMHHSGKLTGRAAPRLLGQQPVLTSNWSLACRECDNLTHHVPGPRYCAYQLVFKLW